MFLCHSLKFCAPSLHESFSPNMDLKTLPISHWRNPDWQDLRVMPLALRKPFVPGVLTSHLLRDPGDVQYMTWSCLHEQNFCLLCWKWLDDCHLGSKDHKRNKINYPTLWCRYRSDDLVIRTYTENSLYPKCVPTQRGGTAPIWFAEYSQQENVLFAIHRHTGFITSELPRHIPVEQFF